MDGSGVHEMTSRAITAANFTARRRVRSSLGAILNVLPFYSLSVAALYIPLGPPSKGD